MKQRLSLIVNTACLDPWASTLVNPHRSAHYASREQIILEKIIPASVGFDEVFVVGQFKEGKRYTYLPLPPRFRDRRDALWQREFGARHSTGNVLVFTHDDHSPGKDFADRLRRFPDEWDILCPQRIHGLTGAVLNNGEDGNYMGAHLVVMRRPVWAEVPWNVLDTEYWDLSMTRIWREAGAKIVWTDRLVHVDWEATEGEQ